jgi:hypothetical protein
MARVAASNVVDACAFFLTAPEFALQGLDVLKHVSAEAHGLFKHVSHGEIMLACGLLR